MTETETTTELTTAPRDYLLSVIAADSPRGGVGPALVRGGLAGLAGLYDVGLEAYLAAERIGLRRRERLPVPMISVGNLSVGGTGKTPMTHWICQRLRRKGRRVAILSRGHGGDSLEARVVSAGDGAVLLTAREAGDEPVLLARLLPDVPVLVGKDRRLTGREALRRFSCEALVLDDGFQYWQLARDLDIVLLDARRPFDNGWPLPRGLLREPKRHLRRAGIVVLTRADALAPTEREGRLREVTRLAPDADAFWARHVASGLVSAESPLVARDLGLLGGARVLAVSGIGQPKSFEETLRRACGCEIAGHVARGDHATFDGTLVEWIGAEARRVRADVVVMTEKDLVKWPVGDIGAPVYALRIAMEVEEEDRLLASIQRRAFEAHA